MYRALLALFVLFGILSPSIAGKPQTACPIMGGAINKEVFVDHEGQRIYFCCPGCDTAFLKEPAKYLKAMADAGITPEQVAGKPQTACPIMGGAIDKEVYVDHEGQRIYFCCAGCDDAFLKEPAKYLKAMADAGITPEQVADKPALCPVAGRPVDKGVFVTHNGAKVYFCCRMCKGKFQKDPDAHTTNADAHTPHAH
jgi:YHS domain-containing protein